MAKHGENISRRNHTLELLALLFRSVHFPRDRRRHNDVRASVGNLPMANTHSLSCSSFSLNQTNIVQLSCGRDYDS